MKSSQFFVQVNLCQKLLFLHQLTHNMTTDCSLFMKIVSSEYMQNMLSTQIVVFVLFCLSEQFWYTTCSADVASFWKRFTCIKNCELFKRDNYAMQLSWTNTAAGPSLGLWKEIFKNAKERKKNQLLHFEGKDSRVESIQDLDFSLFIQIKVHLIKNGDKFLFSWYYQTVYKVTKPSDFKGQFL